MSIAARKVLAAFIANRENLRTIIQRINEEVARAGEQQNGQITDFTQRLEAAVQDNNSEDDINSLIDGIHQLIGEIDREIPSPQSGGFVWRTHPKTPNTPRLTLNKTTSPVRNNVLIRTKTRKTRTKTKKSNPKTIISRISRRTRSKSRS